MNKITFIVEGEVVGKQRARTFTNKKGIVRTITPDKTRNYENRVAWEFKRQCPNIYFIGELEMVVTAFYSIPKSWSKKKKQAALNDEFRPVVKPDLSNALKSIEDALNKVAYDDDSAIVSVSAHKYYSDNPRVEVTIIGEWVTV